LKKRIKTNKEEIIEALDNIYDHFVGLPDNFNRENQKKFIEVMMVLNISAPTFLKYTRRLQLGDLDFYGAWYKT
jgi:hypothetical protein